MNKEDLLREGELLTNSIRPEYDDSFGIHSLRGYRYDDEQRYRNWVESAQIFVYEHKGYPEQYDEFKAARREESLEGHRSMLAIINSINV